MKYALIGIISTSLILYATAFITGIGITLNITSIAKLREETLKTEELEGLMILALIMLVIAIGFKIGLVLFHWWLPDVYGGADPLLVSYQLE